MNEIKLTPKSKLWLKIMMIYVLFLIIIQIALNTIKEGDWNWIGLAGTIAILGVFVIELMEERKDTKEGIIKGEKNAFKKERKWKKKQKRT